ncbi:hypothetical protein ACFFK0_24190 [Paenibacillus chartarius]|uniref:DUF4013 domain-containing protein n=1 Tax=Paenibacillus chartarius TaxID=747481 RepID=A0ABV6DS63_9BACL
MMNWIRSGLNSALRQPFALVCLFVYELLWGFILYRYVSSLLTPLLHRYPGEGLPSGAGQLFYAESHFRLTKTDLIEPYLWTFAVLLALRMIVTPLLNAAVFYSLERRDLNAGYRFFRGIKELGGIYFLYYAILTVLIAAPLPWLFGIVGSLYEAHFLSDRMLLALLPYAGGYLLYVFLLQLLFMYVQFGRAAGVRMMPTLLCWLGNVHRVVLIALAVGVIALLFGIVAATVSYVWAGLAALIIHQLYPLLRMLFKLWGIASQHALWHDKAKA